MNFHVMTLFPEMVMNGLNTSILGRAASNGLLAFEAINIRDYTLERHGKVDDYPYGGGDVYKRQSDTCFMGHIFNHGADGGIASDANDGSSHQLSGQIHIHIETVLLQLLFMDFRIVPAA